MIFIWISSTILSIAYVSVWILVCNPDVHSGHRGELNITLVSCLNLKESRKTNNSFYCLQLVLLVYMPWWWTKLEEGLFFYLNTHNVNNYVCKTALRSQCVLITIKQCTLSFLSIQLTVFDDKAWHELRP